MSEGVKRQVLTKLVGDELPQCSECCGPMFSVHSQYYASETHYYVRFEVECVNGHTTVTVGPPVVMDDDMRRLLGDSE